MTTRDPFFPPLPEDLPRAMPPIDDVDDVELSENLTNPDDVVPIVNEPEDLPHPYFDPTAPNYGRTTSLYPERGAGTVSDTASWVRDSKDQALGATEERAQVATEQSSSRTDRGIDSAAAGLGHAALKLREQGDGPLGAAATKTADTLEQASTYLHDTNTDQIVSDIEAMVRKRPVESALVAAGIGYVLAKILT